VGLLESGWELMCSCGFWVSWVLFVFFVFYSSFSRSLVYFLCTEDCAPLFPFSIKLIITYI
jgi:hypothetical protein